jgi:long-chain acyl-CoA synthetase
MEFRRIFDLLGYQQLHHPKQVVFKDKKGLRWQTSTAEEGIERCNQMSATLLNLGLETGDRIAISASVGSSYWTLLLHAALQIGLVVVPLDPKEEPARLLEILQTTTAKFIFAEDRESYLQFRTIVEGLQNFQKVYVFHSLPDVENLEDLLRVPSAAHLERVQTFKAAIHEDDLAILFQGESKLQAFSHKQLLGQIRTMLDLLQPQASKAALSYLSPGNLLEFLLLHAYLAAGVPVYFAEVNKSLVSLLTDVKPAFLAVHTSEVEALRQYLLDQTTSPSRSSRKSTVWSVKIGEKYSELNQAKFRYRLQLDLADWLRYSTWRRLLGNQIKGIVVAEPVKTKTENLFRAALIPIFHCPISITTSEEIDSENQDML